MDLLDFFELTGDRKYLIRVPSAIEWLENVRLPASSTQSERYTHATFMDPKTNKLIYVHRKVSNVIHGFYYKDDKD